MYWGDYVRDTGDLTLEQHGAFILLLAHLYSTGRPIPAVAMQGHMPTHRICRCATDAERAAVDYVVDRFFELTPDGYKNRKAAEVIEDQEKKSTKGRENANRRWHGNATAYADAHATAMLPEPEPKEQIQIQGVEIDKPKDHKPVFVKPSIQEIKDYCREHGYNVDPLAFLAFYESNGWKVGRNPMKNWRAACTTWHKRNAGTPASGPRPTPAPEPTRNLAALVEAEKRKLAAKGYTKNCLIEFNAIKDEMKTRIPAGEWEQWIRPLGPGCANHDTVICFAPTEEIADKVLTDYLDLLGEVARKHEYAIVKVLAL